MADHEVCAMDAAGILTEEQLRRVAEEEAWESSEESGDEDEEDDSEIATPEGLPMRGAVWQWGPHESGSSTGVGRAETAEDQIQDEVEAILRKVVAKMEEREKGERNVIGAQEETDDSVTEQAGSEEKHGGEASAVMDNGRNVEQPSIHILQPAVTAACADSGRPCERLAGEPASDAVDPERPKHYYIAHELMTTERSYVQSLRLLEKVVHGAIKTAQLTGKTILPESGRKEIFLNLGEMYALNFDLLQELEDRIEHWDSMAHPMIADVMAKRAPFFKLYSMYTARFDESQMAYCKWLRSCKPFADLINMIETSRLCKGLPISSYMLCPIQRIPRYRLLLEDYLRHLPEGHYDAENARAALATISEAAVHMNDRIKDLENQAQVVKIQKSFTGKESLVAPGRHYLGRGPVYLVTGSTKKRVKKKQRILFLFSDILLVTKTAKQYTKYKIKHKFLVKELLVSVVQSSLLENAFCIAEAGMTKPFRLCTKSPSESEKWVKELRKAVRSDSDRRKSFAGAARYSRILYDPDSHSSIMDVLNDPSFEHGQPSWVRASIRIAKVHRRPLVIPARSHSGAEGARHSVGSGGEPDEDGGEGVTEEVDGGRMEVMMEFVSQDEDKALPTRVLHPGIDNSLSSYMNQRSVQGDAWIKRWYVLTSRAIICYDSHHCDRASGALTLAGYQLSVPDPDDGISRSNVIKLSHPGKEPYFFQLPSSYDFERWLSVLKQLLAAEINHMEALSVAVH